MQAIICRIVTACVTIFVFLLSTDVRAHGSWRLLDQLEDPEVQTLASKLPATILHSRADSTVIKYLQAFRRWKAWASAKGLEPISARPYLFALYLQHLAEETNSKAAVEEAGNADFWVHASADLSSPFVKATLEGLQ